MRTLVLAASLLVAQAHCAGSDPERDSGPALADAGAADARVSDTAGRMADTGDRLDLSADLRVDAPCTLAKPYSSKDADCNQCAEKTCCAVINACLNDPECDESYVNCILVCAMPPEPDAGVSGCLQQCASDHPVGKSKFDAANSCAETKCASQCE